MSAPQTPSPVENPRSAGEAGTNPVRYAASAQEHVLTRVRLTGDGCWHWGGALHSKGYARTKFRGVRWQAHRLAWCAFRGEIPDGFEVDHLCRNRACVNPTHLEPVPGSVNNLRSLSPTAMNARKTHCPYGHELDGTRRTSAGVGRYCRTCKNAADRRRYRARRSAA